MNESKRLLEIPQTAAPGGVGAERKRTMGKINHNLYPSANHGMTEGLVEKIQRGEFSPLPPLTFQSGTTILLDGHHRLAAIFHSGQTVQIGIKFKTYEEHAKECEAS